MREQSKNSGNGLLYFIALTLLLSGSVFAIVQTITTAALPVTAGLMLLVVLLAFLMTGVYTIEPNQAAVLSFFGQYVGTVKSEGLRWNNPFYSKRKISLRVRNFESGKLKVNDMAGNPIEIAAIVVWKVVDSAEAVFNVDDYESFVQIQSESALRAIASSYHYDNYEDEQPSLRSHPQLISDSLQKQIQDRLQEAGVNVVEARISHLAYATEIAQAMLQRQQASAIIAARSRIVEGAVGMVEMALSALKENHIAELTDDQRAAMVSNLMVVLCSDNSTQPILNTGISSGH